jgi:hypothetical protein
MTHAASAERLAVLARHHEAWNVLLASYADLAEATHDPVLRQRQEAVLQSFVDFRETQTDYYTWLGLMVVDIQATVTEIRGLLQDRAREGI